MEFSPKRLVNLSMSLDREWKNAIVYKVISEPKFVPRQWGWKNTIVYKVISEPKYVPRQREWKNAIVY